MSQQEEKIKFLYQRWFQDQATVEEEEELYALLKGQNIVELLGPAMKGLWDQKAAILSEQNETLLTTGRIDQMADDVFSAYGRERLIAPSMHRIHFLRRGWFKYAAAIILIAGAVTAIVVSSDRQSQPTRISDNKLLQTDIAPGTNKAVLTIDNKQVELATNKTGITVSSVIAYTDGEKLIDVGKMLTLTTPKGGQYQLVLPDGSKVWLNAASSIKFPAAFTSGNRHVEVTGEVYMEIAQNSNRPFIVSSEGSQIEVLGTSFNINAYENEGVVKTTLVDGSVKVNQQVILKPGQQAIQPLDTTAVTASSEQQPRVITVDVTQALAWKNGVFNFKGMDIKSVMRQLERWYDIKVQYRGTVSDDLIFEGKMYRSVSLSSVLILLRDMGVKLELDGRTLIVL